MKKKNVFFSVVVTVYKNFTFINQAIESIAKQDYKHFEIIIVDTFFSENRKKKVLKRFQKKIKKILYLQFNNKMKAAGARNFGSSFAKGDYLVFLDDDDLWERSYLENLNKLINKKKYDLIVSEFSEFSNLKTKYFFLPPKFNINDVYVYNPGIFPSNTAVKRKTFIRLNGYDTKNLYSSDKIILIEVLRKGYSYFVLKKNLVLRRIHDKQWTNNYYDMLKNNINFYNKYKNNFIFLVKFRFLIKTLNIFRKAIVK